MNRLITIALTVLASIVFPINNTGGLPYGSMYNNVLVYASEGTMGWTPFHDYIILKSRVELFEYFCPAWTHSLIGKYVVDGDTLKLYPSHVVGSSEADGCVSRPYGGIYGITTREHYWSYLIKDSVLIDVTKYLPQGLPKDSIWSDTSYVRNFTEFVLLNSESVYGKPLRQKRECIPMKEHDIDKIDIGIERPHAE